MTQVEQNFPEDCEFSKLLAGRTDVDQVHLMLELAADAYPQLDRIGCVMEIDRLGVACQALVRPSGQPRSVRQRLQEVSRLLYDIEGFHGNRESYYEPENSYLNEVLSRRCGIPISLGMLYMAVAERCGLRMFGVNTPGHFVVGCLTDGEPLYVDPFTNGDVLDCDSCRQRIEEVVGGGVGTLTKAHFRPATSLEITARVLRNLKAAYAMLNDWNQALRVQTRLAALLPQAADEQRDLGLIHLRTGNPQRALTLLDRYAKSCDPEQAAALAGPIKTARKMIAELN
jgi:regulator of sirC expression with transglutaminase-like and TPR domain